MLVSLSFPGYDIKQIIYEGDDTVICRAVSLLNDQWVILKILKSEYPSIDAIARLKHEFNIAGNLDLEGVVKVIKTETHENRLALVFEDFGGQSLKQLMNAGKLELASILSTVIQIAQALTSIHSHHIIHKDIKPGNIIIDSDTGIVKLTDFSIASRLSSETQQLANPNELEGSLAYISPEQTGRMNRSLDYRSDFYSLGVTLYEMLTGQLPFTSDDPLELVYSHIAKQPIAIEELNPKVPKAISSIAMKLMAKNAENRYQTAKGLLADLEICRKQLEEKGEITDFIPGRLDILSQLLIPQKLYGRTNQVNLLLEAFVRVASPADVKVSQANCELILVSGYSGIGKSSVVNEIKKPITRAKGFFISGKFDQFQRDIPYTSLQQAFSKLIRQLLTESAVHLEEWRRKILAAVGTSGQIIIDLIPEVELIIGKQPEVPILTPTESQNRFTQIFCEFVGTFSQKEHPLVIFLDDLQWADPATLKLMQALMTNYNSKYLLIIGAYRDNEVNTTHPLMQTIEAIVKSNITITNINLQPLSLNDVIQLLSETFNENTDKILSFAELLFNKTGGNPFFLTQLLIVLYQEKLLKFDFVSSSWRWELQEIQAIGLTDKSVVELVANRIEVLPKNTQEILKTAACIGNLFTLEILSVVNNKSIAFIASELLPALQSGLILPLNEAYKIPLAIHENSEIFTSQELNTKVAKVAYKFLHDRVQQAAYSLIPEEKKQETHLQIGRLLLSVTPSDLLGEKILDIVNQLNFGIDLLINQGEKNELAKLNLMAGKRAKQATAYEASVRYLNVSLSLLAIDSWHQDYQLILELHTEAAEVEYLIGNFGKSNLLVNTALQKAKTILDKVKLYEIQIQTLMAQNQMSEVLEIGVILLKDLGVKLTNKPNNVHLILALLQTQLVLLGKKVEDLALMPEMTDPYKQAAMKILLFVGTAAAQAGSLLFLPAILAMIRLSIKYGNSPLSAYGYSVYGLILCDKFGAIGMGYRFGLLALKMIDKLNSNLLKAKVYFIFNGTIQFYQQPVINSIDNLLEGMNSGLYVGDIEFSGYCVTTLCNHLFFSGENLETLDQKFTDYINLMKSAKLDSLVLATGIFQQAALNLQSLSSNPVTLVGSAFNELTMKSEVEKNYSYKGYFYFCKTFLFYLFNDYEGAINSAILTEETHASNVGFIFYHVNNLYYSLSLLGNFTNVNTSQQKRYLKQVIANQKKMRKWAENAACNFQHKYDLVEAEKARVLGKVQVAMDLYDSAITGAKENEYTQEYALANELAAKFYLNLGKEKIAKMYMTEAYYGYVRWGAMAKVKELEERYSKLLIIVNTVNRADKEIVSAKSTISITTYSKTTSNSANRILDLMSVIKASQTISSEIVLDKLLEKLLLIIIENAAAQKGCLILTKENKLFIEAIKSESQVDIILQSRAIDDSEDIPISVINYVASTKSSLVLTDAISDKLYQTDIYIQRNQSKSILCAPIFNQGKFIGILYLENNLATGVFTHERVELLKFITSQAAISLENSRLYQQARNATKQLETSLSELKETQIQLVQSEKMSTLGSLVAGIGHEINNPVSFLSGNLQPAKDYVEDLLGLIDLYQHYYPQPVVEIAKKIKAIDLEYLREDLPKLLTSMDDGINRIYDVSVSLRTFSRADAQKPISCNIHEIINSTTLILKHRLKASKYRPAIEVIKSYDELPEIKCFPGQISQVLMNLLANAIDALEDSNAGKTYGEIKANPNCIAITTKKSPSNEYVVIEIKDNGIGMTEEVKQKIFDYLFTTKGVGKGTGLGLSIARQIIVEKHNGSIEVNSKPSEGTEFIIKLPISE